MRLVFRCVFCIVLLASTLFAQDVWQKPAFSVPAKEMLAAASTATAKDSDAVILFDDNILRFDAKGKATRSYRMVYKVLTAKGAEDWNRVSMRYQPWRESKPEIRARVVTADGVEHTLDPKTLTDAPTRDNSPDVYADDRVLHGPLPAVGVGSIVEHELSTSETESSLDFGWIYRTGFGHNSAPSRSHRLLIDAPKDLELKIAMALLPALATEKKEENGRVITIFTYGSIEPLRSLEPLVPGEIHQWPKIDVSTGKSWQAFATQYSRVVDERIKDANLQAFVDKARKASASREAIIDSLVRQLHEQVRYTGVEFGEAAFLPQPPAETLKRKYGDCKDKSALLVAMLRGAGIPAHLALLATGPGEDSPEDVPGFGIFDHAIVYVPGSPDIWIDATAEFSRIADFPFGNQGRRALVVSPAAKSLIITPELTSAANKIVETREVYLAEKGPARFVEVIQPTGLAEAEYRGYYLEGDPKERRKNMESYVKEAYTSDKLGKFESTPSRDFGKPYRMSIEAMEAKRGFTTRSTADVGIRIMHILNRMPDFLLKDAEDEEGQEDKKISDRVKKKRVHDLLIHAPYVAEWRYKVFPPIGFAVRSVPADEVYKFGPASLTTKFEKELVDGALHGTFVFDSGKRRWTPAEVEAFRKDLKAWKETDNPYIGFSLRGLALIAAGKPAEGMEELRSLTTKHPKEALHRIQIAYALLNAGLGEGARAEAKRATQLEPTSADAYRTLGWILQHDLVGRRFRKGFDLEGSLEAYRKAKELDPKDNEIRADYAIVLEHDADGVRFSPAAKLGEALAEYKAIEDKLAEIGVRDNPFLVMWHLGMYSELLQDLQKVQESEFRNTLRVAATTAVSGIAAAKEVASRLTAEKGYRARVLGSASQYLINKRKYLEGADLLAASVEGNSEANSVLSRLEMLRRTQAVDTFQEDPAKPETSMKAFFAHVWSGKRLTLEDYRRFTSELVIPENTKNLEKEKSQLENLNYTVRTTADRNGSAAPIRDVLVNNMQTRIDQDGFGISRVRVNTPGASVQTYFTRLEKNGNRFVGVNRELHGLGFEALNRIKAGNLAGAKTLLDWAREELKIGSGDDPLAGSIFSRVWTRGQEYTEKDLALAAAALVVEGDEPQRAVAQLEALVSEVKPEMKVYATLALTLGYQKLDEFAKARPLAEELVKARPESLRAFGLLVTSLRALGDFAAWEKAANDRLARLPDDDDALLSLVSLAQRQDQPRKAFQLAEKIVEQGKTTTSLYNSLSWMELFDGKVTEKGLEYAHKGRMLSKDGDAPLLHTVAAVYAEVGKTTEARELIMKAMDRWQLEEPNPTCWYVFGRIAEQYGLLDEAVAAYQRVKKPDYAWQISGSSYQLAERRLAVIAASKRPSLPAKTATKTTASTKTGGQN